ncbi:MAG: hypothetical protein J6Y32_08100 [Bacteroidales bacterium]|nr:hypothetical protein [Bacteroidales bacterium]
MLKDEYERRNEINLYDPVVMYVKNKDNRTWCFFDWTNTAKRFSPRARNSIL